MRPLSPATSAIFAPVKIQPNDRMLLTVNLELDKFALDSWRVVTSPYRVSDKPYRSAPSSEAQKVIQRIADKKKLHVGGTYHWEVGATDYTCEIINALWPREQLEFADEQTETTFNFLLTRSAFADHCAEVVAKYKTSGEVPEHFYEFSGTDPLSPYQQVGLYCALQSPGYGLFMEQGTGKTPIGVAAACNAAAYLAERIADGIEPINRMYRMLIVAPNNVRMNWQKEFEKFSTRFGKITVLRGPEVGRIKQLIDAFSPLDEAQFTVCVCGYETMVKSLDALSMVEWDLALFDEAHYCKSTKTKRFQAAVKIRDRAAQRLVLTGTPIGNSVLDLYAPFEIMGKGYSGFSTFEAFRQFYGVYEVSDSGHQALVGVQNLPYMQERLARYSFIITKKEALPDLPEKQYDIYEVEMSAQQEEYYHEVATKLALEIESDLASDQPRSMVINNVLVKLLRLAQITSGFIVWSQQNDDDGTLVRPRQIQYFPDNPKIAAIGEMLAEKTPQQKTIIWSCFVPDIQYLEHACEQWGYDFVSYYGQTDFESRQQAEYRFNYDPNCTVFIGNPAAGGTGLNLLGYPPGEPDAADTNADHIIYFAQDWSQLKRGQSEDRAHRRGTRVPTRITDLVVPSTIDEEIRARVLSKKIHAMEVSDIREILASVLRK